MRVLVISQYFWPESFSINEVVKTLLEKNIAVDVLTGKPNYPDGEIFSGYSAWGTLKKEWNNTTIYRVPLVPRGKNNPLKLVFNYFSFVFFGLIFAPWLLRNKNYDVIFVYAPSPILQAIPAIFLSRIKKCPSVIWVQDLWPDSIVATGYVRNKRIADMVGNLVRWIYSHTDLLLVQSRAFIDSVVSMAPDKKVLYYPNSVDSSFTQPSSIDIPIIPALESGFSVLFAGNIGTAQSVEGIIEAAVILKGYSDINFVVVGSGSRLAWMEEQIEEHQLHNVYLPGRFPIEMMPGFMQKASALLVSLTDKPIFNMTVPNKIQAYMASGRPILAYLNGEGARVVTEAKAGLAIPAEDAQGLADAVLELYKMGDEKRNKLGENGGAYYKEHYDHERLVEQLIEHFENVSEEYKRSK